MNEQTKSTIIAEEKSTHFVEVFVLGELKRHPNADTLSTVKISDTDYAYVAKTEDWTNHVGSLVCWIPPDSKIDMDRPEFIGYIVPGGRVRAKKIRGVVSYGLLVLAPKDSGLKPGDNGAAVLGVSHYDAEAATSAEKAKKGYVMGGEVAKAPAGMYPKYDVDSGMKYAKRVFTPDELVYISEKLHGCSSSYVFKDGEMHCRSRTEWKREFASPPTITLEELIEKIGDPEKAKIIYERAVINFKPKKNLWWAVLDVTPSLRTFCEKNPGIAVYGEIYGQIQKGFGYGVKPGESEFRAFDILGNDGKWLNSVDFKKTCNEADIARVPEIGVMPFDFDKLVVLAEGNTLMAGATHIREGCVVKSVEERWDERLGRVSVKLINPAYLERN